MKSILTFWGGIFGLLTFSILLAQSPIKPSPYPYPAPKPQDENPIAVSFDAVESNDTAGATNSYYQGSEKCPLISGNTNPLDLTQQCRSAVAAEVTAYWAPWQAGLSFAGFVALIITLWFNIQATQAAKIAADAALLAAQQDRAWITYWRQDKAETPFVNRQHIIIFAWGNSGKSPALNVRYRHKKWATGRVLDEHRAHLTMPEEEKTWAEGDWETTGNIGSDQTFWVCHPLTVQAFEQIRSENITYMVYIEIEYSEIYSKEARRTAASLFEIDRMNEVRDGIEYIGFVINPIGKDHIAT